MVIRMTRKQPFDFYVASCDRQGGIYHYQWNGTNVTCVGKAACDRPMYMAREQDTLYVLLRKPFEHSADSGLTTYTIDADGNLRSLGGILSTHGECACYLSVKNGSVYVANYLSGNVVKMPDRQAVHTGAGKNKERQERPHPHYIDFNGDKSILFAADLGTDNIYLYDENLELRSQTRVPDGCGARHITCGGEFVYCIGELSSTVEVFRLQDGILRYVQSYSTVPADYHGANTAAAIRLNNGYLYASNRGHDSICIFKVCGEKLESVCFTPCGGASPRDFNIFGDILICTNEQSDNVTFFTLTEGIPEKLAVEIKVKSPLCVI